MVWPLIVAGGALAATGIGGAIKSGVFGTSTTPSAYPVNPDAYYYDNPLQDELQAGMTRKGDAAPELDWSQAQNDYQMGLQVRGQQQALADHYKAVMEGKAGQSLAQQQLRAGQARAAAEGAQIAASSRGGAGNLVLAQRAAQRQAALGGLAVSRDASMLRAQEQAQAREAYAGMLSGMRGQDAQSRGMSQQQVLGGAGIEMQQRGLNAQERMGYVNAASNASVAAAHGDQAGRMAQDEAARESYEWATGRAQEADERQRERSNRFFGSLFGMGGQMMTQGAMGGGGDKLCRPLTATRVAPMGRSCSKIPRPERKS
jgi:hypothetical protein